MNATPQNAVQSISPALPMGPNEATVITTPTARIPAITSTYREMTGILQVQAPNDYMAPQVPALPVPFSIAPISTAGSMTVGKPPKFASVDRNPLAYSEPTFTQSRKRKTEDVIGASLKRRRTQDSFTGSSATLATVDVYSSEMAKPDTSPELLKALCAESPISAATNGSNRTVAALLGHASIPSKEVIRANNGNATRVESNTDETHFIKKIERLFPSDFNNIRCESGMDYVDDLEYLVKAISLGKLPLGVDKVRQVVKLGLKTISKVHGAYRRNHDSQKADELATYLVTAASREPAMSAAFKVHYLTNAGVLFSTFGITKRLQELWRHSRRNESLQAVTPSMAQRAQSSPLRYGY